MLDERYLDPRDGGLGEGRHAGRRKRRNRDARDVRKKARRKVSRWTCCMWARVRIRLCPGREDEGKKRQSEWKSCGPEDQDGDGKKDKRVGKEKKTERVAGQTNPPSHLDQPRRTLIPAIIEIRGRHVPRGERETLSLFLSSFPAALRNPRRQGSVLHAKIGTRAPLECHFARGIPETPSILFLEDRLLPFLLLFFDCVAKTRTSRTCEKISR